MTERVVFQNNPLVQVITQIQFSPILAISVEKPAAFQERIRDAFPNYNRDALSGLPEQFAPLFARMSSGLLTQDTFRSVEGTSSIYLGQSSLAYEDQEYERWEKFKTDVTRIFGAFELVYAPVFITRTGLRYVDVIQKSRLGLDPETPWDALINPELIGLLAHSDYRRLITNMVGATTLRLEAAPEAEVRINHGTRAASPTDPEEVYFIDADFYTHSGRAISDAIGFLDEFNREAGNLFRWAINPELYDALRPSPVGSELQSLRAG